MVLCFPVSAEVTLNSLYSPGQGKLMFQALLLEVSSGRRFWEDKGE